MTKISIKHTGWADDQKPLSAIRRAVFIEEQAVPEELEWDEHDQAADHWLAIDAQGHPIGCLRLLKNGHIGRMAVLKNYRKQGVGRALLEVCCHYAEQTLQLFDVFLSAQVTAAGFYQKQQFKQTGPVFLDAGIEHISMRKQLAKQRLLGVHAGKFAITDLKASCLSLFTQAKRNIVIFSESLDPETFDDEAICSAISELARDYRHNEIKLLVSDISHLKHSHRLFTLQKRLSSSIFIKQYNQPYHGKDYFIVVDSRAVIALAKKDSSNAWGDFNNQPVAKTYSERFDELWQAGYDNPELRQQLL